MANAFQRIGNKNHTERCPQHGSLCQTEGIPAIRLVDTVHPHGRFDHCSVCVSNCYTLRVVFDYMKGASLRWGLARIDQGPSLSIFKQETINGSF